MERLIAASVAAVAAALGVVVPADLTLGNSPGCVTHAEYDRLETLMRPSTVADLFDTNGFFLGDNDDVFRRGYETCWDGPGDRVVVRYDQLSALSISWAVR